MSYEQFLTLHEDGMIELGFKLGERRRIMAWLSRMTESQIHDMDVLKDIEAIVLDSADYSVEKICDELTRALPVPLPTRLYNEIDAENSVIEAIVKPDTGLTHQLSKSIEFAVTGNSDEEQNVLECIDYLVLDVLEAYAKEKPEFELELQCDNGYSNMASLYNKVCLLGTDIKELMFMRTPLKSRITCRVGTKTLFSCSA